MSKPSVEDALKNRKRGENPASLPMQFDPSKVYVELQMLHRAAGVYEDEVMVDRLKADRGSA
ncbi:MAG: hypothetical protein WCB99_09860 [Candidatus Cybelea sp.]